MMRVLVTGGVGVIGARVVRKLTQRGFEPVVFDSRADFSLMADLAGHFEFVSGDVAEFISVERALGKQRIDAIIHLAAYIDPEMAKQAYRSFNVNTLGTVNVLEAARFAGISRFVHASSRAVYGETPRGVGEPGYQPLSEEHPKRPVSAYDVTKLAAEQMGKLYRDLHGIEFAALRFAGIYGPGKQARHGKMSLRSRLVEDPMIGKPVWLGQGGGQLDDIIYVDDVAEALLQAATAKRLTYDAYNIGSGKGQTLCQFADAVRVAVPGADIVIGPGLNPLGFDVHYYSILDISRAHEDFGFVPKFGLADGVRDYVQTLEAMQTNK